MPTDVGTATVETAVFNAGGPVSGAGLREATVSWLADRRFLLGAVLLVLGFRLLYLGFFGWDPNWMGFGYLHQGKDLWLGRAAFEEPPIMGLLLFGGRYAGLSATAALGAVYLMAHLTFLLGVLGVASFVWPDASRRRRWLVVLAIATLPLLAAVWGHGNMGPLVGASFSTAALALALSAAGRRGTSVLRFLGAFLFAALATSTRYEGVVTVLGSALVLFALGGRWEGMRHPRLAGLGLALGAAAGYGFTLLIRHTLFASQETSSNYGFHTFFDGLPFLMWSDVPEHSDEYGRYMDSMRYFGSFAENGGSIVHALLSNPGAALLRFVTKIPDLFGGLLWPETLGPVGVVLAAVGLRGLWKERRRGSLGRGWVLAAYLGAMAMLFIPPPGPPYFLCIMCPLVLAVARGADRCFARVPARVARWLTPAYVLAAAVLLAFFGRTTFTSNDLAAPTAAYLEERCREGCLTNFLPQPISRQAWVNLEAGAPFPLRTKSEDFTVGRDLAAYRRGFRYNERVRTARAAGYTGPVLYIRFKFQRLPLLHPVFDLEPHYEGRVDLSRAILERRFASGGDEFEIFALPPSNPHAPTPKAVAGHP